MFSTNLIQRLLRSSLRGGQTQRLNSCTDTDVQVQRGLAFTNQQQTVLQKEKYWIADILSHFSLKKKGNRGIGSFMMRDVAVDVSPVAELRVCSQLSARLLGPYYQLTELIIKGIEFNF